MLTCSEYLTSTTSLSLHRKPQKVTNTIIPILQARRLSRIVTYVSQGQLLVGTRTKTQTHTCMQSPSSSTARTSASEEKQKGLYTDQGLGSEGHNFSPSCQGWKRKQRTGLFPFQRRFFLKGLPGSLLLVPHPAFLSGGCAPPPPAVSLHWQQHTAAHRPLQGTASASCTEAGPTLCWIQAPELPNVTLTSILLGSSAPSCFHHSPFSPSSSKSHWHRNPCLRLCIWRTKCKLPHLLLPSLAVPEHELLLLRLRGRRNRRRETEGLENPGMEGGMRPGSWQRAARLAVPCHLHASLPSALCTLGN